MRSCVCSPKPTFKSLDAEILTNNEDDQQRLEEERINSNNHFSFFHILILPSGICDWEVIAIIEYSSTRVQGAHVSSLDVF